MTSGGDPGAQAGAPLAGRSQPRLKPSVDVFHSADGSLYLLRPAADDLMIRDAPAAATELLRRLDGSRTCDQLADAATGVQVDEVLAQLWELGVLEDASRDADCGLRAEERIRYDRQLVYLGELAPPGLHREELQARLAASRVTIVGIGGLGCWTAYALACAGVGELVVVDGDCVEATNLNRQILYTPADVGLPKAHAAARALRGFNPLVAIEPVARRLESEADVAAVARSSHAIVELADWPVGTLSTWISRAARELAVPHLQASQDPPLLRVGPTFIPGATGCAECLAAAQRERYPLYDEQTAFRAARTEEAATFGPACAIVGGVLANEVTNFLLGLDPPATAGRAATVDLRTLQWEWDPPVERRADCPACAS